MKNIINYYYDMNIINLRYINNNYYFNYNNEKYILYYINNSFEVNINLLNKINNNLYFHSIINNKNNQIITNDGKNNYILMKIKINKNRYINISDILNFKSSNIEFNTNEKETNSCIEKWSNKIDYLEYYMNNKENISNDIKACFNYFIGIGENAIEYAKIAYNQKRNIYFDNLTLTHNRISFNDTIYDLYNPLNIVLDHKTRDIAEYLKSMFYNKKYNLKTIDNVFSKIILSDFGYYLLYSRLLFPTFFFDILDSVELEKDSMNKIMYIYDKSSDYEKFLYIIFNKIKERVNIPKIFWLKKKNVIQY